MSEYLQHYGTKGQKWGVRRFQNEDGSYTPEGKERYGRGSGDGMARGMGSGGQNIDPVVSVGANLLARHVTFEVRKAHANKEIAKAKINENKERITKKDVRTMAQKYNRKERQKIIDSMKEDPDLDFKHAEKAAKEMRDKRALRNTALLIAANVAVPIILMNRNRISNTLHNADDAIRRNKTVQSLMKKVKNRKIKNAYVLKDNEYSIDKPRNLPSGRG